MNQQPGVRGAAVYLRDLLLRPGAYRQRWERRVDRTRGREINQRAVCKVLASKLWEEGEDVNEASLKDRVSRALRGEVLSPETLDLFISAFRMSDEHAAALRQQWEGTQQAPVVIGDLEPPEEISGYQAPRHETLMLHEHHWLGPDGLPVRHRTQMNIRSHIDGLSSYQYRLDTSHAKIKAVHGGRYGELYQINDDVWAVDLVFPRPLARGETHYMEFWTLLKYDTPPPREMRRGTHGRTENLDLRVQFSPKKVPSIVWWAEWGHYRGPNNKIIERVPRSLDNELSVHHYLEAIERAVVGFCWEW